MSAPTNETSIPFDAVAYSSIKPLGNAPVQAFRCLWRTRFFRVAIALLFVLSAGWIFVDLPSETKLFKAAVPTTPGSESERALLKSTHCTVPHPGRPLIQYALMIDAGSSGSRIHVYRFNYCMNSPELEYEHFHHVEPGLSNYVNEPVSAARSLDPLLELALAKVPPSLYSCTPVAVKATAGLRMLGAEKSEIILDQVRRRLTRHYPFKVIDDGVTIMDGKDEGVYAWITVNYLLNRIGGHQKLPTAAIFDLGGGSTQIVFEPISSHTMEVGEHKYPLDFGSHHYNLYQHSYLGYGLNAARDFLKEHIIEKWLSLGKTGPAQHPCLPSGHQETYTYESTEKEYQLIGAAVDAESCAAVARTILRKEKACLSGSCSFNGVYQPSLKKTFEKNDIYIFSFFYDRTQPLGMPSEFSIKDLGVVADKVCAGNRTHFATFPNAVTELDKNPNMCLELSFMHVLLKEGYGMEDERRVKIAKKINDVETGWCLGASIAVLDSHRWCSEK